MLPAPRSNRSLAHSILNRSLCLMVASSQRIGVALVLFANSATQLDAQRFQGFTEPSKTIELSSPESGQIEKLSIELGDRVRKGQLLGNLDSKILHATRRMAESRMRSTAKVDSAEVELKIKLDRLDKLQQLVASGAGNREELERARADVELAKLKKESAQHESELAALALEEIDARIQHRMFRSPVDGVVVDIQKDEGEFVAVDSSPLITVVVLERLRVTLFLPFELSRRMCEDQELAIRLTDANKIVSGHVIYVAPITESESGRVRVDVEIRNEDGSIRSGARCEFDSDSLNNYQPNRY